MTAFRKRIQGQKIAALGLLKSVIGKILKKVSNLIETSSEFTTKYIQKEMKKFENYQRAYQWY
jgi:hypothetical protein